MITVMKWKAVLKFISLRIQHLGCSRAALCAWTPMTDNITDLEEMSTSQVVGKFIILNFGLTRGPR